MNLQTKKSKRVLKKAQGIAPLLALLLILSYPWAFGNQGVDQVSNSLRHLEIKKSIESLPFRLGNWHMYENLPLPVGSMKILNPNAYISRSYQRLGEGNSIKANFVLIHCSSARDMNRHHPAKCYPQDGWTILPNDSKDFSMVHGSGITIDYRVQTFERLDNSGTKRVITVINTFLLPGIGGRSGVENLEIIASDKQMSDNGVAQIQINIQDDYRSDDRMAMVRQMVEEMISEIPSDLLLVLDTTSLDLLVKDSAHD